MIRSKKFLSYGTTGILMQIILIAACSSQEEMEIPDYVNQLENLTIHSKEEKPDTVLLVPEQTFRSNHPLIGSIGLIAADHNKRVFIADHQKECIHVFRPDGTYLKQLGKEGRGPGEFTMISDIKIVSGRLIAVDIRMARMSIFSIDSLALLSTANVSPRNISEVEELIGTYPRRYFIRNDGRFLVSFSRPLRIIGSANNERYLSYYLIDTAGEIISDKVLSMRDRIFLTTTISGNPQFATFSFTPHSIVTLSKNDYIYTAWTSDFLIKVRSPDGKYLRSFYYPYDKVPIDRDKLLDNYPHEFHQKIIKNANLPETWPVMANMLMDNENRIWVSTIVDDPQVYQWWLLGESGELLARFMWSRSKRILEVRDGYLYTRETEEETGLQEIVRYRIQIE